MDRLQFASTLARDVGKLAHSMFGRSAASLKGRHDIVTLMDSEVERFIRETIASRFPDDAIIGEEGGVSGKVGSGREAPSPYEQSRVAAVRPTTPPLHDSTMRDDGASGNAEADGSAGGERVWIIDPIDGTANYARGIPRYCVSIGYLERSRPVLGILYDPSNDWLYAAESGKGATCNGQRLAVSPLDDLGVATVECGWSTRRSTDDYVALIGRILRAGCAFRRAGSGALGLADVAAGRVEAYCELHINAWDCAAGILLVQEAGGFTNDFFAGEGLANGNPVIATNAALCDKLAAVIGIPITR